MDLKRKMFIFCSLSGIIFGIILGLGFSNINNVTIKTFHIRNASELNSILQKQGLDDLKFVESILSNKTNANIQSRDMKIINILDDPRKEIMLNNLHRYNDGILDLDTSSGGGNSGVYDWIIKYLDFNGEIQQIKFYGYFDDYLIDLDGDRVREITHSSYIDLGENLQNIDIGYIPRWSDVYKLDTKNNKIELVSSKYPEYYKKIYIPKLQKNIQNLSNKLKQLKPLEQVKINNAIKANQFLISRASLIISKCQ